MKSYENEGGGKVGGGVVSISETDGPSLMRSRLEWIRAPRGMLPGTRLDRMNRRLLSYTQHHFIFAHDKV